MSSALSVYLDLLRLGAALLVFVHHAAYPRLGGQWLSALGGLGHDAVVVFFVLSGFVIAQVTGSSERSGRTYTINRLSRLWSVAVPAVLLTALADTAGIRWYPALYEAQAEPASLSHALLTLGFVNEFWMHLQHPGSNLPFWSLSYEAGYYLIFGLFVFGGRWRWATVPLALLAVGPRIVLMMPAWLFGVWGCRAQYCRMSRSAAWTLALCGALLALGLILSRFGNHYVTWRVVHRLGSFGEFLGHAQAFVTDNLAAAGVAAHLAGMSVLLRDVAVPASRKHIVNRAALVTFPVYLMHYPLLHAWMAFGMGVIGHSLGPWVAVLSLGICLALTPACEALRSRMRQAATSRWPAVAQAAAP